MSDEHGHDDHTGPIKTPKQLIVTVVASFVVPIIVIILLVNYVAFGDKPGAGSEGLGAEAIAPATTEDRRSILDLFRN